MKKKISLSYFVSVFFVSNLSGISMVKGQDSFYYITPKGFEGILKEQPVQTEVYYLNELISRGTVIGSEKKTYQAGMDFIDLERSYKCNDVDFMRKVVLDSKVCSSLSFTLKEKHENDVMLLYLFPEESSIKSLNEYFGIRTMENDVIRRRIDTHIADSSSRIISGSLGYEANLSNYDEQLNASLSVPFLTSYREYLIEAEPTVDTNGGYNNFNLRKLLASKTHLGYKYELGYKTPSQNEFTRSTNGVIPRNNTIGFWYGSTNETLRNKQVGSGDSLQVFMPFSGTIEVYDGDRLIYVSKAAAGMFPIPTSELPLGNYDVDISRRSDSGETLPSIVDTVNNSVNKNGFSLSIGLMDRFSNTQNVLSGDYSNLAIGGSYQSRINGFFTGRASILNIGSSQYISSDIEYTSSLPIGVTFSPEFRLDSSDWSTNVSTNFSSVMFGKKMNGSFSYRFNNLSESKGNQYYLNFSWLPNSRYSSLLSVNANASTYSRSDVTDNSRSDVTDKYREANIQNQASLDIFGLDASLTTTIGTSTAEKLLATASINFSIGSQSDHTISTNYTFSGQRPSYGEVLISKKRNESELLSSYSVGVSGGEEFVRLNADTDLSLDKMGLYLGGNIYRDNRTGNFSKGYYGRSRGSMYFSGNQYVFAKDSFSSGVIVNNNASSNLELDISASISGGNTVNLRQGNNFIGAQSYAESDMYLNSSNSVLDRVKYDFVLYKGNFDYLTISPRKTFEVAGYIDRSSQRIDYSLMRNHESEFVFKKTLVKEDLQGEDNDDYFQLTVSKDYPVIELVDDSGGVLCSSDISMEYSNNTIADFIYLGGIYCNGKELVYEP
jgi:hypothetical protein